ncbi:MAG: hypothetical protein LBF87_00450, partial [Treponema sp.]|nr:hypothetical protein [Treponema sp.]
GSWKGTDEQYGSSTTLTFNSNGGGEIKQEYQGQSQSLSYIWKADSSNVYLYYSDFGSVRSQTLPYTVSGSTLTIGSGDNSMPLTQQ